MVHKTITVNLQDLFGYKPEKKPLILSFIIEGNDIFDAIIGAYPEDSEIFRQVCIQVSKVPPDKFTRENLKVAVKGYFMKKYEKELPKLLDKAILDFIKEEYVNKI